MRFDLTDLRLFVNVAETGTITAGAQASHMTLASASERIRGMEEALGAALLVRERRGVQATAAGRALLHHARIVLQQMDRLHGELGAALAGRVRMLCNTSALSEHLPELLGSFLARHPQLSIDLEERASDEIADALRAGRCDIGVLSDAADLTGLEVCDFRPDPLVLVLPQGHPLAGRARIGLAEVADLPFVGLSEGSALQALIARHAMRLGRRLDYRIRLRSFEAVCRVVGQGIGVGIVPQAVAARAARAARVARVPLVDAWAARQLKLCVRDHQALPRTAQQLVDHLLAAPPRRPPARRASPTPPSTATDRAQTRLSRQRG